MSSLTVAFSSYAAKTSEVIGLATRCEDKSRFKLGKAQLSKRPSKMEAEGLESRNEISTFCPVREDVFM